MDRVTGYARRPWRVSAGVEVEAERVGLDCMWVGRYYSARRTAVRWVLFKSIGLRADSVAAS